MATPFASAVVPVVVATIASRTEAELDVGARRPRRQLHLNTDPTNGGDTYRLLPAAFGAVRWNRLEQS